MSLKSCVPILVTLLLISCGKLPDQAEVKAPSIVEDSFTLKKKKGDGSSGGIFENTNQIGIKISSLDKEFLLQGSLITKPFVRRFENLKSRVVAFKVIDNSLYMLEATKGHDLYAKVTKDIILAKFPIVERTANHLFFDFVEGMSDVFMASDWNAQDFSGGAYPSDQWSVAPVDTSFLKSASFDEHNNLVVHQVAQLRSSASDKFPVEVKYYITPYRENPDFKPSVSKLSDFDKMGFFEVTPQLKAGGESVVYASKFDHNKPIVYAISSNTPEEYKEAIRSGVLYWNKAFGKEILKVIDAPEGVEAPNFKYNIIQWVDWKGAGFAYADAQMDPRTGEILHSQIFLTSVFAFSSKGKAEDLLRRIIESKNGEQQGFHRHDHHHHSSYSKNLSLDDYLKANKSSLKKKMKVGLKGFQKKDVMCHFEFSRSMLSGLERMVSSAKDFDEADYLKISRDYVRETVAHEVGHTLGLRHNFAGSLYTNMDVLKKDDVFLEYAKEGKTPENVVTTSSVMEYQNFEESVMTGDQLVSKDEPLDYDLAAIKTLYHGEKFKKSELPPFCTDSHRMTYVDCRVFDSGKSIYKNSLRTENYYMKHLPDMLLQSYVSVKKKIEKGEARSLKEGSFDPSPLISYALSGRGRIVNSFSESSKFLMVHREHDVIGPYDSRDISLEKAAYIKGQIEEVGGVDKLFKGMELSQVQSLRMNFLKLLEGFQMTSFLSGNGAYFSSSDIKLMIDESGKFFQSIFFDHLINDLVNLSFANNLVEESFSKELTSIIASKVENIIFTRSKDEVVKLGDKELSLPSFMYPYSLRKSVSSLLNGGSSDYYWGVQEQKKMNEDLKKIMSETLDKETLAKNPLDLDKKVGKWVFENKKVISSLKDRL